MTHVAVQVVLEGEFVDWRILRSRVLRHAYAPSIPKVDMRWNASVHTDHYSDDVSIAMEGRLRLPSLDDSK